MPEVYRVDTETPPLVLDDKDARLDRLERRTASLVAELEARIARVADLERQLAHVNNMLTVTSAEGLTVEGAYRKAAEYDALLNTRSFRAIAIPRRVYGEVLAKRRKG